MKNNVQIIEREKGVYVCIPNFTKPLGPFESVSDAIRVCELNGFDTSDFTAVPTGLPWGWVLGAAVVLSVLISGVMAGLIWRLFQ